jgi:hypothetical protein
MDFPNPNMNQPRRAETANTPQTTVMIVQSLLKSGVLLEASG